MFVDDYVYFILGLEVIYFEHPAEYLTERKGLIKFI